MPSTPKDGPGLTQEAPVEPTPTQMATGGADALAGLFQALAKARENVSAVEKLAKNSYHNYIYASAEAIIAEASEAMDGTGLAVFCIAQSCKWEDAVKSEDGKIILRGHGWFVFRVAHQSGSYFDATREATLIAEKGRPEDKAEFGANTEGLAYFLRDLLLIPRVLPGSGDVSGRNDTEREPGTRNGRSYSIKPPAPEPAGDDDPEPQRTDQPRPLERRETEAFMGKLHEFAAGLKLDESMVESVLLTSYQHYPAAHDKSGKAKVTMLGELRRGDLAHFGWRVKRALRGLVPPEE